MQAQINWESFSIYNHDVQGIHSKFEDLCRQLFAKEYASGDNLNKCLHSNHNNAGLESDPIYDERNKRWIGFQAKYFDTIIDYNQIKHSAEKIVEYYSGRVERVYLFCNKSLNVRAKGYTDTIGILRASGISLEPITNNAILDFVRKYPSLALYYFGNHTISQEWIMTHTDNMLDELGVRYNREFNVRIEANNELSLFIHDESAAEYINKKKSILLQQIDDLSWERDVYRLYLRTIEHTVKVLPDVSAQSLCDSFRWQEQVVSAVAELLDQFNETLRKLHIQRDELHTVSSEANSSSDKNMAAEKKIKAIDDQIYSIESLLSLPQMLEINSRERQLLLGDVLAVRGEAGTGKTQLLAYEMKQIMEDNRAGLLLVAGIYFTQAPIHEQIMSNLQLDYKFDDLIDILETIGEKNDCIVPIFIDAINETWDRKLWKSGLPLIVDKIKKSPMVKLVLTYRREYETSLLSETMQQRVKEKEITMINHRGFKDNSTSAIGEFLNHYNIPFTPLEYFGYEMTNPLFLSLYCRLYNGEEVSLTKLYERLIQHANINIFTSMKNELIGKGYSENDDILGPLILEIATTLVGQSKRAITQNNLCKLEFWSRHGISPIPFTNQLLKEHILHDSFFDNNTHYFFAYDQMNDYYGAKAIIGKYSSKMNIRQYLAEHILKIHDGELNGLVNVELFVNVCALYAEKFGEECIDIIDSLTDDYDRQTVFAQYIASFQWRNGKFIRADHFKNNLMAYSCRPEDLWEMLIENSVKISCPLNADFLHELLLGYELSRRDYLWTLYINTLTYDDSNRIVQLVQMYDQGKKLETISKKQIELLLTLFGWLLTSSNRWLRDYTSKAMIELLKEHFDLCQTILSKFELVNDPYVIQRLYGIVFGACCKRKMPEFNVYKALAEYVYSTIFNAVKVYPDILLRDYARMILERFLFEYPDCKEAFDLNKISPPYSSDSIPEIENQHYLEKDYNGSLFWLMHSMRFEGMGMYGDFGRYVFQSALHNFEVDDEKIFNYSIYFILNELKYSEEYFGDHDKHCGSYDRSLTSKIERIGKKYQWITMYNILARVSDHYSMIDRYSCSTELETSHYEGPWNPYLRDFDPTLNRSFMTSSDAPVLKYINDFIAASVEENAHTDVAGAEQKKTWLMSEGVFHRDLMQTLLLKDTQGMEWIVLSAYFDTGIKDLDTKKLLVWGWVYGYFVTPKQKDMLVDCANKQLHVITGETASHNDTYTIFNREYPWAPSCRSFNEYAWVEPSIKTGEMMTITEKIKAADISMLEKMIKQLDYCSNSIDELDVENDELENTNSDEHDFMKSDKESYSTNYIEVTKNVETEIEIGKILHAASSLTWEEEYDATKERSISWNVPCAMLIENLQLKQLKIDGFYYDPNGSLAAFDVEFTQKHNCLVIRKDLLDAFLDKTGLNLIWLVDSDKEIHDSDRSILEWSDWEAVFTYENSRIHGTVHRMPRE